MGKKTDSNNIINFPYGVINSDKRTFCRIKGVNNDLAYQLKHENKVIKLYMSKSLNTLSYTSVLKNNQLYCLLQYIFFKNKVKSGKHVYNIENLNIKQIYTAWFSLACCPLA